MWETSVHRARAPAKAVMRRRRRAPPRTDPVGRAPQAREDEAASTVFLGLRLRDRGSGHGGALRGSGAAMSRAVPDGIVLADVLRLGPHVFTFFARTSPEAAQAFARGAAPLPKLLAELVHQDFSALCRRRRGGGLVRGLLGRRHCCWPSSRRVAPSLPAACAAS